MKLCHAVSLRLGLKGVKITWNIVKVGVNTCLSNGNPNLCSNFNSKKWVKTETLSCSFDRVGLKGGKMARNVMNVGVHACLSNMHPNI